MQEVSYSTQSVTERSATDTSYLTSDVAITEDTTGVVVGVTLKPRLWDDPTISWDDTIPEGWGALPLTSPIVDYKSPLYTAFIPEYVSQTEAAILQTSYSERITNWGTRDLIAPYGDFDVESDFDNYWADGAAGVTVDEGMTVSFDNNSLKLLNPGPSNNNYYKEIPNLTIGGTYKLSMNVGGASGPAIVRALTDDVTFSGYTDPDTGHSYFYLSGDSLSPSMEFVANSTVLKLKFYVYSVANPYEHFDNISLIELTTTYTERIANG